MSKRQGTPNDRIYLKKLRQSFVCPLCDTKGQYKKHYSTLWKLRLHFAFHHTTEKEEATRYIEDYQVKIMLGKLK